MDSQLRSDRQGRPRKLPTNGLITLLWRAIVRAGREDLFDQRFRRHYELAYDIEEVEEYLLVSLRTDYAGDLARRLLSNSADVPVGLEATPFDSPSDERGRLDLMLDLVELLHNEVVMVKADSSSPDQKPAGQERFRSLLNPALGMHDPPLELLPLGHIVDQDAERRELYVQPLPADSERQLTEPVTAAKNLFLKRDATVHDKRAAVQALANALEHLRPDVKDAFISKDEAALFELANGFAIRHNNRGQKFDYDNELWLDWMFHVYLATVHAVVGVRSRPAHPGGEN